MAILIRGKTRCSLCKRVIGADAPVVGLPAFLPSSHSLAVFSDSMMHKECLLSDEREPEIQALFDRYQAIWASRPADLETLDEIEEWGTEAFRAFP